MKYAVLIGLICSQAAMADLAFHCTGAPKPGDMGGIKSFGVSINPDSVTLSAFTLTQKAFDQVKGSRDPEIKAIFNTADTGFTLVGDAKPYDPKHPAKSPKVRYPLETLPGAKFKAETVSSIISYEGERITLFVPLENGTPAYTKMYIEYDGTQGPYWDHLNCVEE